MVGGSKLMANRLGAKFVEIGLRTYFLAPLTDGGAFHIWMGCYLVLIEIKWTY